MNQGDDFMYIKPSAAIRNNYNEISELCKRTGEPVYLTKNGEGDLVVMDIDAFERKMKMLDLRNRLLDARESRECGFTVDETVEMMRQAVKEEENTVSA